MAARALPGKAMAIFLSGSAIATILSDIDAEITALENYHPAEDGHQNYYNLNPGQPYCSISIPPKLKKLKERFPDLLPDPG